MFHKSCPKMYFSPEEHHHNISQWTRMNYIFMKETGSTPLPTITQIFIAVISSQNIVHFNIQTKDYTVILKPNSMTVLKTFLHNF